MNYVWDFAILGKYSHLFWLGLGWTIAYTIGTVFLGTMIGLAVGILRLRRLPVIDWLLLAYIELFRCTPLLVQIIWFYYAFPVVIGVNIPAHVASVTVLCGEMIFLVGSVQYHVLQGQRGQFLSRFLSSQVASLVRERGLAGAMKQNYLEITVVVSDVRGFTAYAQAHPSSRVIQVLRDYYDAVGEVVAEGPAVELAHDPRVLETYFGQTLGDAADESPIFPGRDGG